MPIKEIKQPEYVSVRLTFVIRLKPDNTVVTKPFSGYCNDALSIVYESHTALFSMLFPITSIGHCKDTEKVINLMSKMIIELLDILISMLRFR